MKTRIVILLTLFIVATLCFIPVTQSVIFKIESPFFNVYQQLSSSKKWLKWQHDLKIHAGTDVIKTDSSQTGFRINTSSFIVDVKRYGITNFKVIETHNNKTYTSNYTLIPESKTNKTIVIVTRKTSIANYLWTSVFDNALEGSPIIALKNYMENPLLYYGFIIKKELTSEKLIAVKRNTFLKSELYQQSSLIQAKLYHFVSQNNLKVVYPLQLQYISHKGDSLQIIMGLPVNKKISILTNNIEYMNMPRGKILVGYFKGIYKDREKLYNAMQLYMNDNYIHPMIAPFEVFKSNKLPAGDSTMVDMQVVIPYM
jgi:effector-binding domain-containing protein